MKAVVNRIINKDGETLFLLRAIRPFGLCLPGGKVEATDASDEAAAIRETMEETGIPVTPNQIMHVGSSVSYDGTPVEVFETRLDYNPEVTINKREHLNKKWIKTHVREYQENYTNDMYGLHFAGNTLKFVDLGKEIFVPQFMKR